MPAAVSVVTDGEMRRYAYLGHFIDSIEGFAVRVDRVYSWRIYEKKGQSR